MHRLVRSDNVSGSFEKLLVDADTRVYEQMKLLYVTKKSAVVEAIIESSFVRQLKDLVASQTSPLFR